MKKSKFKLFEGVVAARDIREPQLTGAWGRGKPGYVDGKPAVLRGTKGAIVEVFEEPPGLAVEFFDDAGETIDVAFVENDFVRHQTDEELLEAQALSERLNSGKQR